MNTRWNKERNGGKMLLFISLDQQKKRANKKLCKQQQKRSIYLLLLLWLFMFVTVTCPSFQLPMMRLKKERGPAEYKNSAVWSKATYTLTMSLRSDESSILFQQMHHGQASTWTQKLVLSWIPFTTRKWASAIQRQVRKFKTCIRLCQEPHHFRYTITSTVFGIQYFGNPSPNYPEAPVVCVLKPESTVAHGDLAALLHRVSVSR